ARRLRRASARRRPGPVLCLLRRRCRARRGSHPDEGPRRPAVDSREGPMIALLLLASALAADTQEARTIDVPSVNPFISQGDDHYRKRQDGRAGAVANPREILLSVAAYDRAAEAPDSAEARWKLARALYFQGAYTGLGVDAQKAVYDKARRVGED